MLTADLGSRALCDTSSVVPCLPCCSKHVLPYKYFMHNFCCVHVYTCYVSTTAIATTVPSKTPNAGDPTSVPSMTPNVGGKKASSDDPLSLIYIIIIALGGVVVMSVAVTLFAVLCCCVLKSRRTKSCDVEAWQVELEDTTKNGGCTMSSSKPNEETDLEVREFSNGTQKSTRGGRGGGQEAQKPGQVKKKAPMRDKESGTAAAGRRDSKKPTENCFYNAVSRPGSGSVSRSPGESRTANDSKAKRSVKNNPSSVTSGKTQADHSSLRPVRSPTRTAPVHPSSTKSSDTSSSVHVRSTVPKHKEDAKSTDTSSSVHIVTRTAPIHPSFAKSTSSAHSAKPKPKDDAKSTNTSSSAQ